jgi:hypothetical protein
MNTSNRCNATLSPRPSRRPRWLVVALATAMACVVAPAHAQTYVEAPFFGASTPQAGEWTSNKVAISGDGTVALVGAPTYSLSDESYFTGRAQVFTRVDGHWQETAILTDSLGGTAHSFGSDVALSADGWTALVGSRGNRTGIVYRYNPVLGTWSEESRLHAVDGSDEITGMDVTLSGDGYTAVVSGYSQASNRTIALVFKRSERYRRGPWVQRARLTPDVPGNAGTDVEISDDGSTIALTVKGVVTPGVFGAYYIYRNVKGNWQQEALLTPAVPLDGIAGAQLSADGSAMLGSTYRVEVATPIRGGAAVYKRDADTGTWSTGAAVTGTGTERLFGMCASLSGDGKRALVAVPRGGATGAGIAYVYDVDGSTASLSARQTLVPGMTEASLYFGNQCAMALDGETVLAVAPGAYGGQGVVYPYHLGSDFQAAARK